MVRIDSVRDWLFAPPVTGPWAIFCGFAAVAVPTIIRVSVDGALTGCEFTPYLPFVLLAAILLGWWQAGAMVLVSAAVFSGLFVGPPYAFLEKACTASAIGIFLAASAMIVAIVEVARRSVTRFMSHPDEGSGGIIFSLDKG